MNPIAKLIRDKILKLGPMTVEEFVDITLTYPVHGYYNRSCPIGEENDFLTAPEFSPAFGYAVGDWILDVWQKMGQPKKFNLVEFGPGRGVWMRDILTHLSGVKAFMKGVHVCLLEISPLLKDMQAETLKEYHPVWLEAVTDIPQRPTIVIANEFLDALPVRQFMRWQGQWHERGVTFVPEKQERLFQVKNFTSKKAQSKNQSPFSYCLLNVPVDQSLIPASVRDDPGRSLYEYSPAAHAITLHLSEHFKRNPGAALFIDYAREKVGPMSGIIALIAHQPVNLMQNVGISDVSTLVDFERIKDVADGHGLRTFGPSLQVDFLACLGFENKQKAYEAGIQGEKQLKIAQKKAEMVTLREKQGCFKVLALVSPDLGDPLWPQTIEGPLALIKS